MTRLSNSTNPMAVAAALALSVLLGLSIASTNWFDGLSAPLIATWIAAAVLAVVAWSVLKEQSPVGLILTEGFLAYGAAAALLYEPTAEEARGINALPVRLAYHTASYKYLLLFMVPSAAALVGAWIVSRGRTRRIRSLTDLIHVELPTWSLIPVGLLLALYLYGIGPSTLIQAEHYLDHTGPAAFVKLGQILGPVAILICGYFTFNRESPPGTRLIAALLAMAFEVIYFAVATRVFAIWFPLMLVGGAFAGGWSAHRQRVLLVSTIVLAIFAIHIPLGLRGQPEHGLKASWKYVRSEPERVFNSYNPINNVLVGAPLSLYVGEEVEPLPLSFLATSTNPLPSGFTNWDKIRKNLTVTLHLPFSAVGELQNYGWMFLFGIPLIISALFSWLARVAARREDLAGGICTVVLLGAAGLVVLQSTEYNLRTVCRTVTYASLLVFIVLLFGRWWHRSISGPSRANSIDRRSVDAVRSPLRG